ncbi:hypothetical protein [uncultured Vagococcus sp.]|uniref:hypothetical protein n=1 Tax=uncultured Vagococcus sp. TaxID=189676 RepID=UPI0028D30CB8|nr:hypothetical protein [uncultured Vagococcus sp.]
MEMQDEVNPLYLYSMYLSTIQVDGKVKTSVELPDFNLKVVGDDFLDLGEDLIEMACKKAIYLEKKGKSVPLPSMYSLVMTKGEPHGLLLVDYPKYRNERKRK